MHIQPISFKCHTESREMLRDYGKVIKDTGLIYGKRLEIYSAYSREGKILHKLYYLADAVGNWVKSKLKYYDTEGKCYKVIRSEKR